MGAFNGSSLFPTGDYQENRIPLTQGRGGLLKSIQNLRATASLREKHPLKQRGTKKCRRQQRNMPQKGDGIRCENAIYMKQLN